MHAWEIEPAFINFLDSRCAAEKVAGLKDAKVAAIIDRLAKIKEESRAKEAERRAKALHPTTQPKP